MLSKKTKYAIHALLHLAKHHETKEPILISQIAEKEHIPKKFLEAILLDLKNAGFLNSKKGKGGGYYLLKQPNEINLADIIRLFDGAIALLPCVSQKLFEPCEECEHPEKCGIRNILQQVRDQTFQLLSQSTLSEIIEREMK